MGFLRVLDVIILVAVVGFSVSAASHIAISWVMRKEFEVAMRSPGLAVLSGFAAIVISSITVFMHMLASEDAESTMEVEAIFVIPLMPTLYTGPYILRGFRLLVMYNPPMRKRWGAFAREHVLMRAMVASGVILEVIGGISILLFGAERVANQGWIVYIVDTLLTIAACVVLYWKLRKTDDIYSMSIELKRVGAIALLALGIGIFYASVPSKYIILAWMVARFHASLWVTNMEPIRTILRRRAGRTYESGLVSPLFPYLPWKTQPSGRVAIDLGTSTVGVVRSMTTVVSEDACSVMHMIMSVPPLLEAFKGFCVKALCSESLMFLLDAEAFSAVLEEKGADSSAAGHGYDLYVEVVDKYVREGSPYEVNIECKTRNGILRATDRMIFNENPAKGHILDKAVNEISKMLTENLYTKFRVSQEYKHVQDQLSALEELG